MRIDLEQPWSAETSAALDPGIVSVAAMDAEALAHLMLDAYRGTVDDDGETIDDARAEIGRLFAGEFGILDEDASGVVRVEDGIVAATLITRYEDAPFLAFSMTAPAWQRRGYARAGIERAMARLAARGETVLSLVVTRANEPATRLYERIGFGRVREPH